MSSAVPELPLQESASFADDFLGMFSFFIDAENAAKRLSHKWFWIGPLIVLSLIAFVGGLLMQPLVRHVLEVAPLPPNVSPDQYQKRIQIGLTIQRFAVYCAPVLIGLTTAIQALILFVGCSILSIKARFLSLYNLVAGCALITGLASIASIIVLKAKGEVETQAELRPALGIDIFLPEGTNKVLVAFFGYFSLFELWWIVMIVLIFSAAFKVNKGKAVAVVAPLVILSLLLRLGGTIFAK